MTATNISFMIPVYQRNYDWTEANCKQLWNDIWYISQSASSRTHFLGTICSKSMNGHEKTIIDGQQRITTITLLMKAMHDYVDNDDFKRDIDSTFLRNTGFGVAPNHRIKLHLNRRDDAIYNKLLEYGEFVKRDCLTKAEQESSIYLNYVYFYKCFDGMSEMQIADVKSALDRIVIVDLDVESENPQEIFESLNSTGLDLTDVDLLRNFLLMSLDYDTQVRLYDQYWYKIEENVNPRNMVRFFIDYLIFVKKSDAMQANGRRAHVNENNLYTAFKSYYRSLSGEKERYTSSPDVTERLLGDMHACSKIYRRLVFDSGIDMNDLSEIDRIIYSIVYLNEAASARPVLMFVMGRYLDGTDSEETTLEMLRACLSLVFRAKVTRSYGINGQFAGNVLQRLQNADKTDIADSFWKALTAGSGRYTFPPDNVFKDALVNRPIFDVVRAKGMKYLLYTIEQNSVSAKGLPRYDDSNITIEHVMPKTVSEEWKEYLGDDIVYHDDYLNKLGNLTLTSNNAEMSNKMFPNKRAWLKESSFAGTRAIGEMTDWSIGAIRERSNELADKCLSIWAIPEEYQPVVVIEQEQKRRPPFKFSMIGLQEGDEIAFLSDQSKIATVADDSHVAYKEEVYSLSKLASILLGKNDTAGVAGPIYFTYGGETLAELRDEADANMF